MKIAIKGHKSRGKEVIQILASLGGKDTGLLKGDNPYIYYGIYDNHIIALSNRTTHKCYTLEEFEKEFPFKIGETVITTLNHVGTIIGIANSKYKVMFKEDSALIAPHRLKPYKEMKEERNITLTLDKAKEWYKKGEELREIALQAFTEEELTKVNLPKTWEEFCDNYPMKGEMSYIDDTSDIKTIPSYTNDNFIDKVADRNICPSKKSAEAHLAMIQLEQLRDCWRQGNVPQEIKYKIRKVRNIYTVVYGAENAFLSFCDQQTAEEFLECFRDLIEQAGDLI